MKKIIINSFLCALTFNQALAFDASDVFKTSVSIFNTAKTEVIKQIDNQVKKSSEPEKKAPAKTQTNNNQTGQSTSKPATPPVTNNQKTTIINTPVPAEANLSSTSNSLVNVKAKLSASAKFGLIVVSKGDDLEQFVVQSNSGKIESLVALRYGPGKYSIKFFESAETEKYNVNYKYVTELSVVNNDTEDKMFLLPSSDVQSTNDELINISHSIVGNTEDQVEKVKLIHDYVAELITYDYAALKDPTKLNKDKDALSVFKDPLTVCSGYANLFAALMRAQGIKTKIIYGDALAEGAWMAHAWNEVLINNEWKIIDVTWDDTEVLRYDYFMASPDIFKKDHINGKVKFNL